MYTLVATKNITMKKLLLLVLAFTAGFSFWSCDDKDDHEIVVTTLPTTLELTVKDETGNPVPGATVELYASEQDWNDQINQIGATLTADANGKVVFSDLTNVNYYFLAEEDCLNNVNGVHVTASPLVLQTNSVADVLLSRTGTIKVSKTGAFSSSVFVDGDFVFDIIGGETKYVYNLPEGQHEVLVTSPGIVYPAMPSFLLNCGDTHQITIN